MKNILFFIPALNPGGSERVMATLANQWSKNHTISILTLQNTSCFYHLEESVQHIKMGLKIPQNGIGRLFLLPWVEYKRYCFLTQYLKEHKVDFILSFTTTTNLLIAFWKIFHRKQSVFLSERADPIARNWLLRILILSFYRFADAIICQNEYVKKYFLKHGFKISLPILPNPVNFQDIPMGKAPIKRRQIVTVGRLTTQKNHRLLIESFSELAQEYPQYALKIYGVGPLKNALEQQIKKLKLQNRVFLMGSKKRVMFDVQQSDIFVLPSDFEGFPNVLIEAMACGMPVISSDFPTGVARQLIKDGENGYLFPVGNKAVLIRTLKKMLVCSDKWAEMGKMNRKIAKQYTAEEVATNWMATIHRIIAGRKK